MERLLVTGVDYPIGSNLALALADRFEVLGLYQQHAVQAAGLQTARCEMQNTAAVADVTRSWRPRWILHCGPLATGAWNPPPAPSAADAETKIVARLADVAAEVSARLTVISSDVVFSGPRMFHDESAAIRAALPWAVQVRNMERALEGRDALVVRTHAYGWSPVPAHADFAERAFESLASGGPMVAGGRRYATPILATDLADLLWRGYETRLQGLFHLAGAERTNPFRFVTALATACGFRQPSFVDSPMEGGTPELHEETSLTSKRARRLLEMSTPMLREGLDRFATQAQNGWRDRWSIVGEGSNTREMAA